MEEAELKKIARIARMEIGRKELEGLEKDIDDILEWASQLKRLKVHQLKGKGSDKKFRDDKTERCEPEPILENFPKKRGRFLEVPRSL
jgi:aspartyl/glutamyl-tRNA(Asn/Gln) amidotransferase C subunit